MREYFYNLAIDKNKGIFASALKFLLLLLSFLYGFIIRALRFFSFLDQKRFDLRIISIGNITVGGTGKTSLVELVSRYLKSRSSSLAILTRGYKRKGALSIGDEPRMLAKNLKGIPVIVNRDRVRGARRAIREYGVDTVILDDGLQQWRIKKDLEIVTIDALCPFGNGHMLPRGILREPLSSLRKADIFVLTKTDLAGDLNKIKSILNRYNSKALVVESVHRPLGFYDIRKPSKILDLGYLKGKRAALLCGIGDPGSFLKTALRLGIRVEMDLRFSDHYIYTLGELKVIADRAREKDLFAIVTTEKDAARLLDMDLDFLGDLELLVLRVELDIVKNEEQFFSRLLRLYSF
ncbi:MAG: tetraacyldisaccharide 4'-kinase [Candidatus Omnitrophica bacterium]|nr:tetraacyldisaccharide 4'-kinase [Candidatus Omnitrophota bacterium]